MERKKHKPETPEKSGGVKNASAGLIADKNGLAKDQMGVNDLVKRMPGGVGVFNYYPDGRLEPVYMNDGYYKMIGGKREEREKYLGGSAISAVHPDDAGALLEEVKAAVEEDRVGNVNYRVLGGDGRYMWLNVKSRVAYRENGITVIYTSHSDIDEQRRALLQLEADKSIMELAGAEGGISLWIYDIGSKQLKYEYRDKSAMGLPLQMDNVPDCFISEGIIWTEDKQAFLEMYERLEAGEKRAESVYRMLNRSTGRYEWRRTVYTRIRGESESERLAVGISVNADAQQETRLRYEHELKLRREIIKNAIIYYQINLTTGIIEEYYSLYDDVKSMRANVHTSENMRREILENVAEEDRETVVKTLFSGSLLEAYSRGDTYYETIYRRRLPRLGMRWVKATVNIMTRPGTDEIIAFIYNTDITEEKQRSLDTQKRAETDGMTGLFNKTTTEELISRHLMKDEISSCALILADLDGLKHINDTLGHDKGDMAITSFARALRAQFRQTDIVGRVGGDEFVVFLSGGSRARLSGVMGTFMKRLSAVRIGDNNELRLHGSMGVAIGTGQETYEELFKMADKALYHVKRNGKNNYAFYTPEMEEESYSHGEHTESAAENALFFDNEELNQLLYAVSVIYALVISVDLADNSYSVLRYDRRTADVVLDAACYDELVALNALKLSHGDREAFAAKYNREALLKARSRGIRRVGYYADWLFRDGVYRKVSAELVFIDSEETDGIKALLLARRLDGNGEA